MEKTVRFEKELYSKNAILAAINDFKDFVEGDLKEDKETHKVKLKTKRENPEETIKEFKNYTLGMTKILK
ncbi:MAG: HxsD-like protein [Nanobdellota archaeon]